MAALQQADGCEDLLTKIQSDVIAKLDMTARELIEWSSHTLGHFDGLLLRVVALPEERSPVLHVTVGDFTDTAEFYIHGRNSDQFSLASMLICTNDGLAAANRLALPRGEPCATVEILGWVRRGRPLASS